MSYEQAKEWMTKELAESLFYYKDGILYWKNNQGTYPTKDKPVGSITKAGYFESRLKGKSFKVHRVIFLLKHGYMPKVIDHIDGNRTNNEISNLREATFSQNKVNQKIYSSNTSGLKGVFFKKATQKWNAQINFEGKRKHLGTFQTKELAAEFVDLARQMLHKEFARAA
jgi:hypothetical protein